MPIRDIERISLSVMDEGNFPRLRVFNVDFHHSIFHSSCPGGS